MLPRLGFRTEKHGFYFTIREILLIRAAGRVTRDIPYKKTENGMRMWKNEKENAQ